MKINKINFSLFWVNKINQIFLHSKVSKMQNKIYIFLFILVFIVGGCRKNEDISDTVDIEYPTEIFINTSVKGTVKGSRGIAIPGAVIQIGSIIKTSDFNGYFQFENVSAKKSGEIIKVEKPGFQTSYKTFYPQKDAVIYVDVEMTTESGNIIANTNDPVKVFGNKNAEITITGNDFILKGNNYSGKLSIKPYWSAISDKDFYKKQIGDPVGYDKYYKTKGISSYGIIGIDIFDEGGQTIGLGNGNFIELKINNPSSDSPMELSVWKFNFEKNKWLETNIKAKLITQSDKTYYTAEVENTGIYNFGSNFDVYEKEIEIKSSTGIQAQFIDVEINSENLNYRLTQRTSDKGKIISYLPTDKRSEISIILNNLPFTYTIKKDESSVNIPADHKLINVRGKIRDCSGFALENGYITIISNNDTVFYDIDSGGNFNCNIVDAKNEEKIKWIASDTKNEINTFIHKAGKKDNIDLEDIYLCEEPFAAVEFGDERFLLGLKMKDITTSTMALEFGKDNYKLELACLSFNGEGTYDLSSFPFTFAFNESATKRLFPVGEFNIKILEFNKPGMLRGKLEGKARKNFDDETVRDLKIIYSVKLE